MRTRVQIPRNPSKCHDLPIIWGFMERACLNVEDSEVELRRIPDVNHGPPSAPVCICTHVHLHTCKNNHSYTPIHCKHTQNWGDVKQHWDPFCLICTQIKIKIKVSWTLELHLQMFQMFLWKSWKSTLEATNIITEDTFYMKVDHVNMICMSVNITYIYTWCPDSGPWYFLLVAAQNVAIELGNSCSS